MHHPTKRSLSLFVLFLLVLAGCRPAEKKEYTLAATAEEIQEKTTDVLKDLLHAGDTSYTSSFPTLRYIYQQKNNTAIWSDKEKWQPVADSFFQQISDSRLLGLFPEDYHFDSLSIIRKAIEADSLGKNQRRDPLLWARADLLFTDAFVRMVHDVKIGRLPSDSVTLNKDSVITDEEYLAAVNTCAHADSLRIFIHSLEPREYGYVQLKEGIKSFLDSSSFIDHTPVPSTRDQLVFRKALQQRLFEEGLISQDSVLLDSTALSQYVKKFQRSKDITVDGKVGEGTLRMLNLSDKEKFIRIAISLDKYKKLPAQMPEKYIMVNASANLLYVIENGELKFTSKVITGKSTTRTPMLNSYISVLITYPQWVPPPSIITKEILPAVKKNPAYLSKKGFSLLDNKGDEVDPFSVDWSKYNKSIPFKVVQGSGDANALGIMKFHFDNKYSVYLHDTNQRYLFANAMRSLSHGCVRVQQWQTLLHYILANDSLHWSGNYTRIDSVETWLKNKEKRQLALRARMPLFIRYFTCQGQNGKVVFYDDVYGDDKMLRQRYFASK